MGLTKRLVLVFLGLMVVTGIVFAASDAEGSKDHPLFNRMPGFFIDNYEEKDFETATFRIKGGEEIDVEGKYVKINYRSINDSKYPSETQIQRNYINAVLKIGGQLMYQQESEVYQKIAQKGETWVKVETMDNGWQYELTIVEKGGMEQNIQADATSLSNSIQNTGKVALYGIYFDTGKAEVKAESESALKEIAQLLKTDAKLKLLVVGHTDNVGKFEANMLLSKQRADAVVKVLVSKYGIAPARLMPCGAGSMAPVASNQTEEGRAQNRRVELVEQ
jgi:outer membrane protein OmpA-like peptidoglycan-associated protein